MESFYFNPERAANTKFLITDNNHLISMKGFLTALEKLEPHCINDLEEIFFCYCKAREAAKKRYEKKLKPSIIFPNWNNIHDSKLEEFILLKKKIEEWAKKYNLYGLKKAELFIEIALSTIEDYYFITKEAENPLEYVEEDFKLSLINVLEFLIDDEAELISIEDDRNKSLPMNALHPFTFSPTMEEMIFFREYQEVIDSYIDGDDNKKQEILKRLSESNVSEIDISRFEIFDKNNFCESLLQSESFKTTLLENPEIIEMFSPIVDHWEGYGFDGRYENIEEFKKILISMFEIKLKIYKRKMDVFYEKISFTKGKVKRVPQHFDWLVMYQVQGLSPKKIADSLNLQIESKAIKNAVITTASEVGLKLRSPDKGGRPKKK